MARAACNRLHHAMIYRLEQFLLTEPTEDRAYDRDMT
jgi:hypothetical protein